MSTFLQDGEIMIKIGSKYLHFNSEKGDFIGNLKFDNSLLEEYDQDDRLKTHKLKQPFLTQDEKEQMIRPDIFKHGRVKE